MGLDVIVAELKSGLRPPEITEKHGIPKQTLSYSLAKLKKMGCVEKAGYGVWKVLKEVPNRPKDTSEVEVGLLKKDIRGHAFIWRIEFVQPYHWAGVVRNYKNKKLTFQIICSGKVFRTILNGRKIWLTKKGLTIYEPLDFMGRSSFEVKGTAVFEMDRLIKTLLKTLGLKFKAYRFTTSREHYGMVKNELARQYNDRGDKMVVRSEDGTAWLWIDDSNGLGELETNDANISRQVQTFWNNHKKHGFKVTPDFILESFDKVVEAIGENAKSNKVYGDNSVTHVALMKKIDANLDKQTKCFENIRDFMIGGKK